MAKRVILLADPGLDTAVAVGLALHDPALEVVALAASAGNVSSQQATRNVHILIEQMDPPRWPKLGAALPIDYDINGAKLHGEDGLGNVGFPCSQLHNILPSDKLIQDQIRLHPDEVTLVCMGPLTALASVLDRETELVRLVKRLVILGGTIHEPGDVGPVSEFHFTCDPVSVRHVLRSEAPITMIPLDIMRKVLLAPSELLDLPASRTCQFLQQIVPAGIGAMSNQLGIEGFYLQDVLGVIAVSLPELLTTEPMLVDVETTGELTRGMAVIDRRPQRPRPNVEMVVDVNVPAVHNYIRQVLERTA